MWSRRHAVSQRVCIYMYIYTYIYILFVFRRPARMSVSAVPFRDIHTHTHTHIYIYICSSAVFQCTCSCYFWVSVCTYSCGPFVSIFMSDSVDVHCDFDTSYACLSLAFDSWMSLSWSLTPFTPLGYVAKINTPWPWPCTTIHVLQICSGNVVENSSSGHLSATALSFFVYSSSRFSLLAGHRSLLLN